MPVNTFTSAVLCLVAMAAPAAAATFPAEIMGHNVQSRFLPGEFIDLPTTQSLISASPPAEPQLQSFDPVPPDASGPPLSSGSGTSVTIGGGSGTGKGVGTVPLPGALPMFGAALLGLSGIGLRRRRRRTSILKP